MVRAQVSKDASVNGQSSGQKLLITEPETHGDNIEQHMYSYRLKLCRLVTKEIKSEILQFKLLRP